MPITGPGGAVAMAAPSGRSPTLFLPRHLMKPRAEWPAYVGEKPKKKHTRTTTDRPAAPRYTATEGGLRNRATLGETQYGTITMVTQANGTGLPIAPGLLMEPGRLADVAITIQREINAESSPAERGLTRNYGRALYRHTFEKSKAGSFCFPHLSRFLA